MTTSDPDSPPTAARTTPDAALVGLWLDGAGTLHRALRSPGATRSVTMSAPFRPFAWMTAAAAAGAAGEVEPLGGPGAFDHRVTFPDFEAAREGLKGLGRESVAVKPFEQQWLMREQERLFAGLRFSDLRRCQLDIETASSDPSRFSDPTQPGDRVLAIGLRFSGEERPRLLRLEEETDAAERALLKALSVALEEADPDLIEGHNIFNFDLTFLRARCRRFRVKCRWGRFGGEARFRSSRLRVAERWIDFTRCDVPGRTVFDTYLALQLWDVTARELPNYRLKDAAIHFGITAADDGRTYLPGSEIQDVFRREPERFLAYLADDLRETAGLADRLLPTYLAQVQNFPMLLEEVCLRGTGQKVDLLLLERYYAAATALPEPPAVEGFAGAFSKSYGAGVYRRVMHFDVASLYPSLLLQIGRNPAPDSLGALLPLLRELRAYRLDYKQRARYATDPAERAEFDARQASFKVLINSFYGYLGFPGARFADSALAAEVTARGRELLQALIAWFEDHGMPVLEADTDGLYVEGGEAYDAPDRVLEEIGAILPAGIELEFDGRFEAMFAYKAKNYALLDGDRVKIRGSALRSRGTEPFLGELTHRLIHYLLGVEDEPPETLLHRMAAQIEDGSMAVERLAKSEFLSLAPETYREKMEAGGKPRRAALEAALKMAETPRMGEKVRYYLAPREKGMTADWQRAFPLEAYDPAHRPYDARAYLKKLRDWDRRYRSLLGK